MSGGMASGAPGPTPGGAKWEMHRARNKRSKRSTDKPRSEDEESCETHASVSGVLRMMWARENEVHRRQVEKLTILAFWGARRQDQTRGCR